MSSSSIRLLHSLLESRRTVPCETLFWDNTPKRRTRSPRMNLSSFLTIHSQRNMAMATPTPLMMSEIRSQCQLAVALLRKAAVSKIRSPYPLVTIPYGLLLVLKIPFQCHSTMEPPEKPSILETHSRSYLAAALPKRTLILIGSSLAHRLSIWT